MANKFFYLLLLFLCIRLDSYCQDTLSNISDTTTLTCYSFSVLPEWGFKTGHNAYGRESYAEKYFISGTANITGVISRHTGKVSQPNRILSFEVYSVGPDKFPLSKLASTDRSYGSLDLNGNPVITTFGTPALVTDSFFVAFSIWDYAHEPFTDTIGLLSATDGSRPISDLSNHGRNVLRIHHGGWEDFYSYIGLRTNLAIFPIVDFALSNKEKFISNDLVLLYNISPNPVQDILTLNYFLKGSYDVGLQIFDFNGKCIITQELGIQNEGQQLYNIVLNSLESGSYFLVLNVKNTPLAIKFLKS